MNEHVLLLEYMIVNELASLGKVLGDLGILCVVNVFQVQTGSRIKSRNARDVDFANNFVCAQELLVLSGLPTGDEDMIRYLEHEICLFFFVKQNFIISDERKDQEIQETETPKEKAFAQW